MNRIDTPLNITTQRALRAAFWAQPLGLQRVPGRTQNDYPADVRSMWVEFVDTCARDGRITEALAQRATL